MDCLITYYRPVSYTHLDVYKRQDLKYLPCEIVNAATDDKIDDIDYLLCDETGTAVDNNNDETVIDIIMTDHTKGDWTILGDNKLYDIIIWNNPVNCNGIVEEYKNLNNLYIDRNDIMNLIKNELCRCKTRLLYDYGGKQLMCMNAVSYTHLDVYKRQGPFEVTR